MAKITNVLVRWSGSPGAPTSNLIVCLPKWFAEKHDIHAGDRISIEVTR